MTRLLMMGLLWAAAGFAVELTGEWRRHDGDDPRWSAPDFDDRDWQRVTLPITPSRSGRYWLRRKVTLTESIEEPAIALGRFAHHYEVFVDGAKVGETLQGPLSYYFPPRCFAVPGPLRTGTRLTLAIRANDDLLHLGFFRGLPEDSAYLLGTRREAALAAAATLLQHRQAVLPTVVATTIQLLAASLLFLFWATGERRRELVWFAGFVSGAALNNMLTMASAYQEIDKRWSHLFLIAAFGCLSSSLGSLSGRASKAAWPIAGAAAILHMTGAAWRPSPLVDVVILAAPMLPAVVWAVRHAWKSSPLRWVAAPVLAYLVFALNAVLGIRFGLAIAPSITVGPFHFYITTWISAAFGLTVGLLMIRNAACERREKARLAAEMDAARRVQQFLIPATAAPGIDAVYLPAAEVGGDFWHLLDGRLLVAGDVSGKGLKAAMVVSLITGMLDRRHGDSPAAVLTELNRALHARLDGGFVTCCIARLDGDGRAMIASAGHPAPYADGRELDIAASLPLGVVPDAAYTETAVSFGEQLTLVSDGVIEAANGQGELFGFDRTREISTRPAPEIAEAARVWGQNDDITVVTVRRNS